MMKSIDRIAIFFAILLVSVSVVPAFAGSPADTVEDPLSHAEADAGAADNLLSDEPPSDQTGSGDDSSGVDEGPPDQDIVPDAGEDDDTSSTAPEEEGTLTGTTTPTATDVTDPAGNDTAMSEPGETPTPTLSPEETPVVDPKPVVTEGPGQDDEPAENTTATNETSVSTVSPEETQGADPGPVETASPDAAAENTTAPLPTDTIDAAPSTGTGVVENESVSSDTLPENETAGESVSRAAVLCVWEQLDPALGWLDDDPVQAGSQFLPPCAYGAEKTVQICAVVAGGGATPDLIVADVVSPDGSPFSRVNLTRQDSGTDALEAASMAGLVTYAHGTSLNEAVRALEETGAAVYAGELDLLFSQAPGDYHVSVQVLSKEGSSVEPLASIFTYLPTASFEIDFSTVDYGTVEPGENAWVEGDADFGTAERPTVRNTGNVPIRITVVQDNMGLGVPVSYMAKLGNSGTPVAFGAMEEVTLPGVLPVNETASISLALRVPSGGEGTPGGRLQVSCVPHQGEH